MNQSLIFTILFLSATFSTHISIGQTEFELPQTIQLNTKEDYANSEITLINAAKWLEETDLDKEADKRLKVNAFIIQWISGSPTVNIEITASLGKIYGKNLQLLPIYMASYARDIIEHKGTINKYTATKTGLISIMDVYKKGIEMIRSKEMDKIIKMSDSELDNYIGKNFK